MNTLRTHLKSISRCMTSGGLEKLALIGLVYILVYTHTHINTYTRLAHQLPAEERDRPHTASSACVFTFSHTRTSLITDYACQPIVSERQPERASNRGVPQKHMVQGLLEIVVQIFKSIDVRVLNQLKARKKSGRKLVPQFKVRSSVGCLHLKIAFFNTRHLASQNQILGSGVRGGFGHPRTMFLHGRPSLSKGAATGVPRS